jgi:hypothetical protein
MSPNKVDVFPSLKPIVIVLEVVDVAFAIMDFISKTTIVYNVSNLMLDSYAIKL